MKDILEGRKNEEAYSAFFEHFLPCATKKTLWDRRIAKAVSNPNSKKYECLCTISDEAFALLLLENSYNQWLDLFFKQQGTSHAAARRKSNRDFNPASLHCT
jgi:hypothetical protein